MAQRLRERRVNSEVVQGAHSYVRIKRITLDEAREFREKGRETFTPDPDLTDEQNDQAKIDFDNAREVTAREQISKYIIEWDWVDDDGKPMPQPLNNPDAFKSLTDLEWAFLQGALTDTSDLEKKPPSKKG